MSQFYVGKKVIAITNSDTWSKGDTFEVLAIKSGCHCACLLDIGLDYPTSCPVCSYGDSKSWFDAKCFAPIHTDFQSITLTKIIEIETPLICIN
jgi:hypothetical protein